MDVQTAQRGTEVPGAHELGAAQAVTHLTHRFGDVTAVNDVTLAIRPGELAALLGPSGCGKTTLLRIIAGLLRQSEGHVAIGGQVVDDLAPNERGAGIVFQNYALFPHMTVEENVAYGLRAQGYPRREIGGIVTRMLDLVRMTGYRGRYPRELSGGQQQRIALARTLAVSPKVLLLDEPFGALDKNLRLDMQIEVKRLQRELNITTIMVTHDQEEALSMADRVAVMRQGRVEQFASPEEIYDMPQNEFIATFIGTANSIAGELVPEAGACRVVLPGDGELAIASARPCSRAGPVTLTVRPEHLHFVGPRQPGIAARIEIILPLGPSIVYQLALAGGEQVKVTRDRGASSPRYSVGDEVRLAITPAAPVSVFER